jgi:hypothetical protein
VLRGLRDSDPHSVHAAHYRQRKQNIVTEVSRVRKRAEEDLGGLTKVQEFYAVIVGGIAIHRVNAHGRVAAYPLRRTLAAHIATFRSCDRSPLA